MTETVHIVCLDAPSPPDYGGAIDMYYLAKSLAENGKKIILHYFNYKQNRNARGLEEYCAEVHSYKRKNFSLSIFSSTPYIIHSRINQSLINRLNKDNHSIVLEGIHCAGIIPHLKNKKRVLVRMLNEEASYYQRLAATESNFLKRKFYNKESKLINRYQQQMDKSIPLACLSKSDIEVFQTKYHFTKLDFIPCFIPWQSISIKEGKGNYCLYHGNMSVSENENAALWLVKNVFSKTNIPFTIAGKNISKNVSSETKNYSNISLVENHSDEQLDELIQNAHINVLPSMNNTGVKLKVLHALFIGRFCISNSAAINGSGISSGVLIAESEKDFLELIQQTMLKSFSEKDIEERKSILDTYNNKSNAEKLSALL